MLPAPTAKRPDRKVPARRKKKAAPVSRENDSLYLLWAGLLFVIIAGVTQKDDQ
jgi:hypothetical protein